MINYLNRFCLLLGLSISCALLPAAVSAAEPAIGESYINKDNLHCDQLDVTVESYCQLDERLGGGACYMQKVHMLHTGTGKVSEKFYLYENYLNDQSMISYIECVKGTNKKNKVVLRSGNLGNCRNGCEWNDYFSETGAFLGSDRLMFGATNTKPKKLPANFFDKSGYEEDRYKQWVTVQKVFINRQPRGEK